MSRSPMHLLEDALVNVELSTGSLDEVLAHFDTDADTREQCIGCLARLILIDVAAVRAAYDGLQRKRPKSPTAGGGGLTVVKGGAA